MSCQLHKNQKIYKQFQLATSSINWVFIQNFVQTQCQTKNKGNPENNFFKFPMSLNCHYMVLMKNDRDKQQISILAKQFSPNNKRKTETQKSLKSLLIETNELNYNTFKDGKERTFHII